MTRYALNELGHKICFRHFWKQYLTNCAIALIAFGLNSWMRFFYFSPRVKLRTQISIVLLQSVVVYIVLHVLFVIQLFNYFMQLHIKYIHSDYRHRMHDSMVHHSSTPIITQLRLYQNFHFKLWQMVDSINRLFSFTILILSYHAFATIGFSSYFVFLYTVRDDTPYLLIRNVESNIRIRQSTIFHFLFYCSLIIESKM